MARRSYGFTGKTIAFTNFTGLNTEAPPLSLSPQEATVAVNWTPLLGNLQTRQGFQSIFTLPSFPVGAYAKDGVVYTVGDDGTFCVNGKPFGTVQLTSGINPKFAWFDPYVCIATGQPLYLFNTQTSTLQQTSSPPAVDVLVEVGRAWIGSGDMLYASAVGDPTSWTNNTSNLSSAQYFQIGYKDGHSIVGLSLVYFDLIIYKTMGIHRLSSLSFFRQMDLTNVMISLVTPTRTAINNTSIVQLGTDTLAIDSNGAYTLGTAMKYGDMVMDDIALKVRTYLNQNYDGYTVLLPPLRAVAFRLQGDNNYSKWLLYFYEDKAWLEWYLPPVINLLVSDNKQVYGVGTEVSVYGATQDYIGVSLYSLDPLSIYSLQSTPIYPSNPTPINAIYRTGIIADMDAFTIRRLGVGTIPEENPKNAVLQAGRATVNFSIIPPSPGICDNTNAIYQNVNSIYAPPTLPVYHQYVTHRVFNLNLIFSTLDNFTLSGLYCDIVPSGQ